MTDPRLKPVLSFFFLLTLVGGLLAALFNPVLLESPAASVRDGGWTAGYQEAFDSEFALLEPARSLWNALDLTVFGQTPAGVLSGKDGWLFTLEEYAHAPDPLGALTRWLDEIELVNAELAGHGSRLLVALVPGKASLLTEVAPPLPQVAASRHELTLDMLMDAGLAVVDLRSTLASPEYWLKSDTHWTPEGAEAAAAAIATAAIRLEPGLLRDTAFEVTARESVTLTGDLARLLALGPFHAKLGPDDLELTQVTVSRAAESGGSLFDDVTVDVALVGTSYSAGEAWNLADRLRLQLGSEVVDAATSGQGPLVPMRDYLASDAFLNASPRLVIWEIPERYLTDLTHLGDDS